MSKSVGAMCCAVLVVGAMSVAQTVVSEEHPGDITAHCQKSPEQLAEDHIESLLNTPLTSPLNFDEVPLNEILDYLANEYSISIVIDRAALDELAISPEQEITVNLQDMSLRSAFKLLFREPGVEDLTFIIDSEALLITSNDRASETAVAKVYRVDDLIRPYTQRFNSQGSEFDELIDLTIAIVEPESWMENGTGDAEIMPFEPGMLVISQTRRIHQEIDQLFTKMRCIKQELPQSHELLQGKKKLVSHGFKIDPDALKLSEDTKEASELLSQSLIQSVQWDSADDTDKTKVWLRVLPNLVMVRHTPQVVEQVGIVMADLGLRKGGGAIGCYGGGGGNSQEGKAENKPSKDDGF